MWEEGFSALYREIVPGFFSGMLLVFVIPVDLGT